MMKKLAVTIAAAALLSSVAAAPAGAAPMRSNEQLARLAQSVPDGTARISGVPTTWTIVSERYYTYMDKCAVERIQVMADSYGLFRHHTKSYWC